MSSNLYIVPYDFTPVTEKALEYAIHLGKRVHAEILIVHLAADKPKGMVMLKEMEKLKGKLEITRFKGLGEISPDEFVHFIGEDIRLDPVMLDKDMSIEELLSFYMGKNTPTRQEFIIENLKVELDIVEDVI